MKTVLALGAFALVHSALASRRAKRLVATHVPRGAELYRAAYNAQSVVTFGAVLLYISRLESRTLYRVDGPLALAMRLGQSGGILFALVAARATGAIRMAGLDNLIAVLREEEPHPVPVAQGPERFDDDGELEIVWPFTISRHPLNLAPLLPYWLTPHLTTRRLAFNLASTAYLILGSIHEEKRLSAEYGEAYERYRSSGVPFYLPLPARHH